MKTYRHIIFDFDGVLCDSLSPAIQTYNLLVEETFPQVGHTMSKALLRNRYQGDFRASLAPFLAKEVQDQFLRRHAEHMREKAPELPLFPQVRNLLEHLGPKGYSVVTGSFRVAVEKVFSNHEIPYSKETLIFGNEAKKLKYEKIQMVLHKKGLSANEAIYVGDLPGDIRSCRKIQVDIASAGYGYAPSSHLETHSPDFLLESVSALTNFAQDAFNL